jgi:hypothetical protein
MERFLFIAILVSAQNQYGTARARHCLKRGRTSPERGYTEEVESFLSSLDESAAKALTNRSSGPKLRGVR